MSVLLLCDAEHGAGRREGKMILTTQLGTDRKTIYYINYTGYMLEHYVWKFFGTEISFIGFILLYYLP